MEELEWYLTELEVIKVRLDNIHRELGLPPAEPLRPASQVDGTHKIIRGIGLELNALEGFLASPSLHIPATTKEYACPIDDCAKSYKVVTELHKYIRLSTGRGYKLLQDFINQRTCSYCPEITFQHNGDLLKHESNLHLQVYRSRLCKILPHFGLYESRPEIKKQDSSAFFILDPAHQTEMDTNMEHTSDMGMDTGMEKKKEVGDLYAKGKPRHGMTILSILNNIDDDKNQSAQPSISE